MTFNPPALARPFLRSLVLAVGVGSVAAQVASADEITLIVPGGAGGGWDLTARAMKSSLESEGLARVRIEASPGPGGSVALAQLLSAHRGDPNTLLVGGLVMLSASASQHLAISPLDATAVARLTGDYPVVVVPAASPFRSVGALMTAAAEAGSAFPWGGGSSGSLYERLVGDLYEAKGLSRSAVNYVPRSSGREVSESLVSGRVRVGVSEAAEIAPFLSRGDLRALAVASPERLPGLDIPTLKESGFDLVALNWRGVFAGPGLPKSAEARLDRLIQAMVRSPSWKEALERRRWTDLYLGPGPFRDFIETEYARWSVPPRTTELPAMTPRPEPSAPLLPPAVAMALLAALVLLGLVAWPRLRPVARAGGESTGEQPGVSVRGGPADEGSHDEGAAISQSASAEVPADEAVVAFEAWKLTAAEREIAEFMLQGLRYKQIAGLRGTSERTVRQQAQIILKKAGLDGRADLAAHFLHRSPTRSS